MRHHAALLVLALLLTACAAQTITRTTGDVADYRKDRLECLKANGWTPMTAEAQLVWAMADVALGTRDLVTRTGPTFLGPPPSAEDGKTDDALNAHVFENRAARACLEARGYVLPW